MNIDGFTLYPLINELNHTLSGGRIDKILQLKKDTLIFFIRMPGQNYVLNISVNSNHAILNLTTKSIEAPATPTAFCMLLRKHLESGRIATIKQNSLDRHLYIDIDVIGTGGAIITKQLTIELMGKYSNVILLQDKIIIDSIKKVTKQMNRFREILPNHLYIEPPKQNKINMVTTSTDFFFKTLLDCKEITLYKALMNTGIGIGPTTAQEILAYAKISSDKFVKDLSTTEIYQLNSSLEKIKQLVLPENIQPTLVKNAQNKIIALLPFHSQMHNVKQIQFTSMSKLIDYTIEQENHYTLPEKDILSKLVKSELIKLNNKLLILSNEFKTANNAYDVKVKADLLITFQNNSDINLNGPKIKLPNIYSLSSDNDFIEIEIDPTLSLIKNSQTYYHKYNKLKRAQVLLSEQIKQTNESIRYLDSIDISLSNSQVTSEIDEIKKELIHEGYIREQKRVNKSIKPSSPLKLVITNDTIIWIGKNNFQNDMVTFKIAQPNDIWLHIKDHSGSHVIINSTNKVINDDILLKAAKIAAYFSQACGSTKVPIDYTQRRYVKKPSKAKPGFVTYTNQKTIFIDSDKAEVESLIAQNSI